MEIKKKTLYKIIGVVAVFVILIFLFSQGGNKSGGNFSVFEDTSLFPSIGPSDAAHTIIEFSDFQCPHCTIASGIPGWTTGYSTLPHYNSAKNVKEMAVNGEVRFIYVSMSFLGQESVYASQAALCANKQGKFWEMHDAIFRASTGPEENVGRYSKANLKIIAESVDGLNEEEFANCLDNNETVGDVQKISNIAKSFASSTPTFFVDGVKVSSAWSEISTYLN